MLSARDAGIPGLYIYLGIENMDVLRQRIERRKTQTPESIAKRLAIAHSQMSEAMEMKVAD